LNIRRDSYFGLCDNAKSFLMSLEHLSQVNGILRNCDMVWKLELGRS
jgi:hypothetical protein